jgi:hypothetical protein
MSSIVQYTFERATVNGRKGWIVTRWIDYVFAGRSFGKTKQAAIDSFEIN